MLKNTLFTLQKKKTHAQIEKSTSAAALLAVDAPAKGRKRSVFDQMHEKYMDSLLRVSNSGKKPPERRKRESSFYARSKYGFATPVSDEHLPEQNAHYFKRLYRHTDEDACYEFAAWFLKETDGETEYVIDSLNAISYPCPQKLREFKDIKDNHEEQDIKEEIVEKQWRDFFTPQLLKEQVPYLVPRVRSLLVEQDFNKVTSDIVKVCQLTRDTYVEISDKRGFRTVKSLINQVFSQIRQNETLNSSFSSGKSSLVPLFQQLQTVVSVGNR